MSTRSRAVTRRAHPERVVSCPGAALPAAVVEAIAAAVAGRVAAGDTPVVAVDGCERACASRTLEARGVPVVGVEPRDLEASADAEPAAAAAALLGRALERVDEAGARAPRRRSRRPPAAPEDGRRAHTTDDYLFAVSTLTSPVVACGAIALDLPTLAAHVAHALGVSRASAGEMLARVEREGLVERGPGREILLTEAGRDAARRVERRHRVVERFLSDVLGYPLAEVHGLAARVRSGFDDAVVERLVQLLPPPARCPHGWPFDPAVEENDLVALSALPSGAHARAVALVEQEAAPLARLDALGLRPGARVEVLEQTGHGRALLVDGRRLAVDVAAAGCVLCRPEA